MIDRVADKLEKYAVEYFEVSTHQGLHHIENKIVVDFTIIDKRALYLHVFQIELNLKWLEESL